MGRRNDRDGHAAEEMASLAERMGYMQALRATLAVVVLVSAFAAPDVLGASLSDLIFLTSAYLLLSAAIEGLRRGVGKRGIAVLEGMLLVDAMYLALVGYATGGTQSPLRFLVYIHLIAVTLLASHRTGMKIAIWHSLLFFVTFYAQASSLLPPLETVEGIREPSIFNVSALLLVATVTMTFSSVNERELRRRKADLEALTDTARQLEDASDATDIASMSLHGVAEALGFERGLVLAGPPGARPELLAFRGKNEPFDSHPEALDEVVARAWETHSAQLVRKLDPDADERLSALIPFAENLIVMPLFAEGDPFGVLVVESGSKRGARLERRVVTMLGQFASHTSLALRNAWLLDEVQKLADTDALTGIANRRTFETVLERELSRAKRNGEQVTLVMMDIDHFKKLNDTHGHQ
ncbi:MAG: GGDEF domain-containing protein, partial [Actinomycetota bacterium]